MAKVDYAALAPRLLNNVGGEENIASMTHCATRMRFVLKDESKASTTGMIAVVSARLLFQQPTWRGNPWRSTSRPTMLCGSTLLSLD